MTETIITSCIKDDTPLKICEDFKNKTMTRKQVIQALSEYPYHGNDTYDMFGEMTNYAEHSFSRVVDAVREGLITLKIYEEIIKNFEKE